jgi:hypothetical protein
LLDNDERTETFLEHHGIKGQKWGIRNKSRNPVKLSSEHKRASELKKKPVRALTNEQLKELTSRQQLEQKHRKLNPNTADKGKKHLKAVMGTAVGAASVYSLATGPAAQAAIKAGKAYARNRAIRNLVLTR